MQGGGKKYYASIEGSGIYFPSIVGAFAFYQYISKTGPCPSDGNQASAGQQSLSPHDLPERTSIIVAALI